MWKKIKNYLCKIGLHDYRRFVYYGRDPVEFKHGGLNYVYFLSTTRSEIRCIRCNKKGTKCSHKKPRVLVL